MPRAMFRELDRVRHYMYSVGPDPTFHQPSAYQTGDSYNRIEAAVTSLLQPLVYSPTPCAGQKTVNRTHRRSTNPMRYRTIENVWSKTVRVQHIWSDLQAKTLDRPAFAQIGSGSHFNRIDGNPSLCNAANERVVGSTWRDDGCDCNSMSSALLLGGEINNDALKTADVGRRQNVQNRKCLRTRTHGEHRPRMLSDESTRMKNVGQNLSPYPWRRQPVGFVKRGMLMIGRSGTRSFRSVRPSHG